MVRVPVLAFAAACLAALQPGTVRALTIIDPVVDAFVISETRTVRAVYAKGDDVVFERVVSGGPETPLDLLAETEVTDALEVASPPTGPGFIRAAFSPLGASLVQIDGRLNDSLTDAPHVLRGEVVETTVGSGASGGSLRLSFAFLVEDVFLELWDYSGIVADGDTPNPFEELSPAIGLRVDYEVSREGVPVYRATADRWGGRDGLALNDRFSRRIVGVDADGGPVFGFGLETFYGLPGEQPRGVSFADLAVPDLDLGLVAPFGFFEVAVRMSAEMILPPVALGAGGRVNIGDPNALEAVFGTIRVERAEDHVIPAPPAGWLLLLGLAAVRLRRRLR